MRRGLPSRFLGSGEWSLAVVLMLASGAVGVGSAGPARGISPASSVEQTLVLANGTLLPGNFGATNAQRPVAVAYDASLGQTFVKDAGSGSVSVLNNDPASVLASIPLGAAAAYSGPFDTSIVTDDGNGIAYSGSAGAVYVSDTAGANVSVIADATREVKATIPVGTSPEGVVEDPALGEVFVADAGCVRNDYTGQFECGNTSGLSVISESGDRVVATVPLPFLADFVSFDSTQGTLFVSTDSGVSVVDAATDAVVANLSLPIGGNGPYGVAYDPSLNEVFTVDQGSSGLEGVVISAITNAVTSTFPLPGWTVSAGGVSLGYDPLSDQVWVAGSQSTNVTRVDPNLGVADGNFSVVAGAYADLAYDPTNRAVLFPSAFSVDQWGSTGSITDSLSLTYLPDVMTYDTETTEMFIGGGSSGDTVNEVLRVQDAETAIQPPIFLYNGTASAGDQYGNGTGLCYDPLRGEVFATLGSLSHVYTIQDTTGAIVGAVPFASPMAGLACDPAAGVVYAADPVNGEIALINETDGADFLQVGDLGYPNCPVLDESSGDLYVPDPWGATVHVISLATDTVVSSLPLPGGHSTSDLYQLAIDPATRQLFVTDPLDNQVEVLSLRTGVQVADIPVLRAPSGIAYDPNDGDLFVADSASDAVSVISDSNDTVIATIPVGSVPGPVAYDPGTQSVYVGNTEAGSISIIAAPAPPPATPPLSWAGLLGWEWAALAGGIAVIGTVGGFWVYRRRRTATGPTRPQEPAVQ